MAEGLGADRIVSMEVANGDPTGLGLLHGDGNLEGGRRLGRSPPTPLSSDLKRQQRNESADFGCGSR